MPAPENITNRKKTTLISNSHWLAIGVGVICLIFQLAGFDESLRFSRDEIADDGEWWRLLTGNLVHLGYPHLFLNLAGLALITLLLAPAMTAWQWSITGLVSMLGVGTGLWFLDPQLHWYVGLSGALYGLLLGGAIAEFRYQRLVATVIALYTVGKVIWEQLYGAVDSSEKITGGTVIVNAHLYGMVTGAAAVIVMLLFAHNRKKDTD